MFHSFFLLVILVFTSIFATVDSIESHIAKRFESIVYFIALEMAVLLIILPMVRQMQYSVMIFIVRFILFVCRPLLTTTKFQQRQIRQKKP